MRIRRGTLMESWLVLPEAPLDAAGPDSVALLRLGCQSYRSAARYLHELPYGRNADRADFRLVLPRSAARAAPSTRSSPPSASSRGSPWSSRSGSTTWTSGTRRASAGSRRASSRSVPPDSATAIADRPPTFAGEVGNDEKVQPPRGPAGDRIGRPLRTPAHGGPGPAVSPQLSRAADRDQWDDTPCPRRWQGAGGRAAARLR